MDTVGVYSVYLGRGGVGKRREGDGKVPLGRYKLGVPRASEKYGTFIPIGYPTDVQRKKGYTGSAVGIHGPPRAFKWLGAILRWFDTTEGCVGLATDEEIERIAAWIRKTKAQYVEIR
jgi:murein L,D-transpeptidase YafK